MGDGETGGVQHQDSICHVSVAQSPGFEKPCAHLLAVLPEASHLTSLKPDSSVIGR